MAEATVRKATTTNLPAPSAPAATASTRKPRQSNFELLRIVAMLMIVAHHMVRFAAPGLDALPLDAKWLYFFAIESGGEVGVDIFLIISVWFLAGRAQTLKTALRHVAKTEAVVLFYSISLYFLAKHVLHLPDLPGRLALRSIAPTITGLWWYITCYTLVVLASPFLVKGLRSLGRDMHRQLVVLELAVVSILPMFEMVDLFVNAYVSFLAIVVMVTYVRWYRPTLLERPAVPWLMLALSLAASVLVGAGVRLLAERGVPFMTNDPMHWEWSPGSPLVLGEAFGLFLIFGRLRLTNRAVNFVARSTVGVYLIHEHPGMRALLWQRWFPFEDVYGSGHFLLASVLVPVAIFLGCIAVDVARRTLFRAASHAMRGARGRLVPAAPAASDERPSDSHRSASPRQESR